MTMKCILSLLCFFLLHEVFSQNNILELNNQWQFRKTGTEAWNKALVPGNIYSDLKANKLIEDPFYRDNEKKIYWVDSCGWEYKTVFDVDSNLYSRKMINLVFDGLDTYASVMLNGQPLIETNNMFRQWQVNIKPLLKRSGNRLSVVFRSAIEVTDSMANRALPLVLPDNNRVYARKAQCQFGWDWGPRFIGCGIWKRVWIDAFNNRSATSRQQEARNNKFNQWKNPVKLIRENDSIGKSFYFTKHGKPVYAKGANWIPANIFLTDVKPSDYRRLLKMAKDANMNMIRVWGGGIYEDDLFYDLCDEMGIMVWQDFMFAGGMYPGDTAFISNVKEEVKQQILRLRHHPSIVLWCGNNEIDEAWKNWGWQKQFNLYGEDSIKIYHDYKKLFMDSLPSWVNEFDGKRPYVHTSPLHGWGRQESYVDGDSHYWGLWWGLEDWEMFKTKTGRFVSEYGMQAMPDIQTVNNYTAEQDRYLFSDMIRWHQKANNGFEKLNHYLTRYFIDSSKLNKISLNQYVYLSQCLQHYILKNSIATHRSKEPANMGTLLWQLNDCWPVTSWSIIDFNKQPKAAWYAVRDAYAENNRQVPDSMDFKKIELKKPGFSIQKMGKHTIAIQADEDAWYIHLSLQKKDVIFNDNYFNLRKSEIRIIQTGKAILTDEDMQQISIQSLYDIKHNR